MSSSNKSAAGNIEHVIVLMFENRSFDHLLGAMPGVHGVLDANGKVRSDLYNTMNPTQAAGGDNPATQPTVIAPDSNPIPAVPSESDLIVHDFTHEFGDGMMQDLFGPGTTGVINGQPQNNPPVTYPSANAGFLSTIAYNVDPPTPNGVGAMTYFDWGSMEIFHTLAQSFVVCDAWFCDMPGHTGPNRAFMHCATTGNLGIDDDDRVAQMVGRKTIFEQIQDAGATWKMYWPGSNCDTDWLNEKVFSQQFKPHYPATFNVTNVPMQNFLADLESGHLPFYSFLMSFSPGIQDTSMHPSSKVEPGEHMLACVYNALRQSPYWKNTLLVVNFDENGGMYDHCTVPAATPPDNQVSTWYSSYTNRDYVFDFSVLGVRIPVLLISPWLNAGVCGTQLQNTSVLRFLQDLLPGANPQNPYSLTPRDLHAPSIASVFDYDQFGAENARTDCPNNLLGYGGVDAAIQFFAAITPDTLDVPPAPHIEELTKRYLAPLPGHPDSGKPITRHFATIGEMLAYAEERREAALVYIRAKGPMP